MKKKNISKIIFIIADTLRAKNVGLYGKKPSPTPNTDKLGEEGVVFQNAYTTSTKTESSITAIMSGKYPLSSGLISHGKWLSKKQEKNLEKTLFLADILRREGYKTAAVDWFPRWQSRGFDYYSGKIIKDLDLTGMVNDTIFFLRFLRLLDVLSVKILKKDFFTRFYYTFFKNPKIPYDPADIVVDEAIKILRENKKNKLFLYLHFRDPHFPHIRPKGLEAYLFDSFEKRYDAEIAFMDEQIFRLITYLQQENMEETLILFTADHGESLNEHGITIAHRGLYDNVVKIPLIIKHSSFPARKIGTLVQNLDIFPTILECLGIPLPKKIDGKSLLPLIFGKKTAIRNYAFFEDISFGELKLKKSTRKRGIRRGDYKYIETLEGKNEDLFAVFPTKKTTIVRRELYDLKENSEEKENLIEKKTIIARKLESKLKKLIFGKQHR